MKKNIYLLYAVALLQGMVFYGPIATLYRQARGVSVFEITLIEGISLALALVLEVPWGVVADRIGYRKTMCFCSGLYFVSKLVFWQANGFAGFLLERILLSVVLAGYSGVDTSILYLSCRGHESQRVFGIYHSMSMVGLLLAAGVFSLNAQENDSHAALLTVHSYGIAAVLSLGLAEVKETGERRIQREPFRTTLWDTLRNRSLLWFLLAMALLSETHQMVTVFLSQLQYERCGLDHGAMGVLYMAAAVLGLLGVCSVYITNRMGQGPSLVLFGSLAAFSCVTLALTSNAVPSILGILTLRLSHTLLQPLQSELQNRQIQTENRATALSIHSMVLSSLAIGIELLFGVLADRSLPVSLLFGGVLCVLSLPCLFLWQRQTVQRRCR